MAMLSGTAASFAALKAAVEAALVARGWALVSGILTRGAAFVQFTASATELRLLAGTGQAGSALVDPCPHAVKMMSVASAPIVWPLEYTLHVFDAAGEATEVYLASKQGSERFLDTYRRIGMAPFKEAIYG